MSGSAPVKRTLVGGGGPPTGMLVVALFVGLLIMLTASAVITLMAGELDLSFVDAEYVKESMFSFLRMLAATAPYFGLAILLAIIEKSATAGIAFSFGVAFLEGIVSDLMSLADGWVAKITPYLLDANGDTPGVANGGQLETAFGGQSALGQATVLA